jgi:hypothetical protein
LKNVRRLEGLKINWATRGRRTYVLAQKAIVACMRSDNKIRQLYMALCESAARTQSDARMQSAARMDLCESVARLQPINVIVTNTNTNTNTNSVLQVAGDGAVQFDEKCRDNLNQLLSQVDSRRMGCKPKFLCADVVPVWTQACQDAQAMQNARRIAEKAGIAVFRQVVVVRVLCTILCVFRRDSYDWCCAHARNGTDWCP